MDPNEHLRKILELAEVVMRKPSGNDEAEQLAHAVADLDTWIVTGGFLPARWSRK